MVDGIQELVSALQTDVYDSSTTYNAEVSSIDNEGTVWVYLAGSDIETPTALSSAEVSVGDNVNVEWRNNKLYIAGNVSNPSAGTVRVRAVEHATEVAKQVAQSAVTDAGIARQAAEQATEYAEIANEAADRAETEANRAYKEAEKATGYANDSLSQLGIVEDVVGTLNWITTHATYKATADTEVHAGKWYFTKSGDTYNVVVNPTGNPSTKGWYEIDSIDEAVSNYVASHVALTDDGLWLTKDNHSYKILLASDGMRVYDNTGHLVSTYGESIIFDSSRPQKIGNNTSYIEYYDSNNDGIPDAIRVVADSISFSNGKGLYDDLEIGGRNLFISYDSLATEKRKINNATSYTYDATTGVYVIKQTASSTGFVQIWTEDGVSNFSSILGKTVTLSVRSIVTSRSAANAMVYCYCKKSDGSAYSFGLTKNELTRTFVMPTDVVHIGYIIRLDQNEAGSVNETATFTGIKLELGNKATDWTPAPEDVQAEIDAKKSVHTLMSSSNGSTYANILTLTAEGRMNTSWGINTSKTPLTNVKIGDTCRVAYKVTDMNSAYVYVVGELTSISGNTIYMTMHGLDTTIIDGGNILTNSIGANQIKANELAIGQSQVNGLSTALANTKKLYKHNVDLTSSSYNQDTWYPVLIGPCPSTDASIYFRCSIAHGGGTPSWSSHPTKHWACEVEASYSLSAWGWKSDDNSYIDAYTFGQTSTKPIVLSNALSNSAYLVVYLRGGGYYPIQTSIADTPQIKTSSYTESSQTVAPTTTQPANTTNFVISRREGDTKTNEAAKTATSYITNIGNDGIRVHPASTENNSVLINSDGMTVYKGGTADTNSVAFYGDTARIGKKDSRHVEVKTGGMQVYNGEGDSNMVTHIGYESVQGETGTTMGAFFTFGSRRRNQMKGEWSVAEGIDTTASGWCSHAEGFFTTASSYDSHAEGHGTTASGRNSHAEGIDTTASGYCSHAEGDNTTASGYDSHAEGYETTASGDRSHAEGYYATASGWFSHAEGNNTTASGSSSHAEGNNTTASGIGSHAGGGFTHASRNYQTVIGKYNKIRSGSGTKDSPYVSTDAAFIIGGGTARTTSDSKDIFSVGWDGNVKLAIDSSATGSSTVDGKIMDSLRSLGWDASTEGVIV